jgi:hypothetical protein
MAINGVSSSLAAIQIQTAAMDRAAEKMTRVSSTDVAPTPSTPAESGAVASQESGMAQGTVEMIVAHRMFSAAIKMAQTANEGILESLRGGGYDAVGAR